jgi:uncharacterized membrane protein
MIVGAITALFMGLLGIVQNDTVLKSALGLPLNLVAKHGWALVLIFPWRPQITASK